MSSYNESWSKDVLIPGCAPVALRLVRPSDKPLFRRAANEFSEQTMARRFFGAKRSFSDDELQYLTEVDGYAHLAIVGVTTDASGACQGVAAARFIRCEDDPTVAEFAVIVGDPWQKHGLGAELLRCLAEAAFERGIRRFKGDILSDNTPAFRLIDSMAPNAEWLTNGIVAVVQFDVAQLLNRE